MAMYAITSALFCDMYFPIPGNIGLKQIKTAAYKCHIYILYYESCVQPSSKYLFMNKLLYFTTRILSLFCTHNQLLKELKTFHICVIQLSLYFSTYTIWLKRC